MENYMRNFDDINLDEMNVLKPEPWMLGLLEMNPSYTSWSNYEDAMGSGTGWSEPLELDNASELWGLDDLNELVNFYFEIIRPSEECQHCERGFNPETEKLNKEWFAFEDPDYIYISENQRYNNNAWQYHLTKHEVDALWDEGRLHHDFKKKPTAKEVNQWAIHGMGHDAINQHICVKARGQKMGIYGLCEHCHGSTSIYDPDIKAHVELQMWMLHPRKGCSRGVRLMNIHKEDLPTIYKYLNEAKERFNDKFSKIPSID